MPEPTEAPVGARRLQRSARAALEAVRGALGVIEGESVRLRAMALTYISLFALVPALVVAFSVLQAFTGMDAISERVHEFLFANLAVGARNTIEPYLDRFIRNAHATSAGLVGGALLVYSAVTLFSNVERAVNDIWGVKRRRTISQQAVIYWVGLTLGPLLLAGSVTLGHAAQALLSGARVLVVASGTLLTCAFFATLYQLVPNTRVKLRAALVGGLVAGVAWEVAKWGYTFAVGRFFRYHAIYGSVAAVPIFLFWLFVSWTILLFGARIAYLFQHAGALSAPRRRADNPAARELLAGQVMLAVARAFDAGEAAPDGDQIANLASAPAEEVNEALTSLRQGGLLLGLADGGYAPARSLERITLLDVRRAVAGPDAPAGGPIGALAEILKNIADRSAKELDGVTLRELCDQERGGGLVTARAAREHPATDREPGPTLPGGPEARHTPLRAPEA